MNAPNERDKSSGKPDDFSKVPVVQNDDAVLKKLRAKQAGRIEAFKASTRLTEADYQLRINTVYF